MTLAQVYACILVNHLCKQTITTLRQQCIACSVTSHHAHILSVSLVPLRSLPGPQQCPSSRARHCSALILPQTCVRQNLVISNIIRRLAAAQARMLSRGMCRRCPRASAWTLVGRSFGSTSARARPRLGTRRLCWSLAAWESAWATPASSCRCRLTSRAEPASCRCAHAFSNTGNTGIKLT